MLNIVKGAREEGGGGGVVLNLYRDDIIDVRRLPKPVTECHVETRDQARRESFDFATGFQFI